MNIEVPADRIEAFCRKWQIREFALFGSVLRDDFRPDSDVDVLVTFDEDAQYSLFDLGEMNMELEAMFGRRVDLVQKELIENPFRRHHILANHRVVYAV
ncbi:MAG TPA: nucleotidyltransferase domain-containing protein [Longimicrobiaceae bacterium]|nr:nucleotidyltransferase domain-containing protein [Longimicrobiaceae bacterium]